MDFSEAYPFAGPHPQFSPNGEYLAVVVEYRILIRSCDTLRVVQLYSCLDRIQFFDWSPDSKYVLCCLKGKPIVQIWSIDEPDWTCKINEGPAGITGARWCPDARSILLTADFQIKATIWSLVDRKCVYIKGPKFSDKGIDFSQNEQTLLVAERYDCKDYLTIFSCDDWKPRGHFQVDTEDLSDAKWCPGNETIAVWDSLLYYKILLYSIKGTKLGSYSAYTDALGIKTVQWSPTGRFISVGSFDEGCRILDSTSWFPFLLCEHSIESAGYEGVIIYREIEEESVICEPEDDSLLEEEEEITISSKYTVIDDLIDFPPFRNPPEKPDPKIGIGMQCWSPSEKYLATKNDNCPWVVWIWNVEHGSLVSIMIQKHAVKSMAWDPNKDILAVCCGNSRIYLWSYAGASVVHIPIKNYQVQRLIWNKHGPNVVLVQNRAFCLGYLLDV